MGPLFSLPWLPRTLILRPRLMLTPSARLLTAFPSTTPMPLAIPTTLGSSLVLTTDTDLCLASAQSATVDTTVDMDISATLATEDTTTASVRPKLTLRPSLRLMLMLTPSARSLMVFPSTTLTPPATPHNVGVITGVDYGHGRVSG